MLEIIARHFAVHEDLAIIIFGRNRGVLFILNQGVKEGDVVKKGV